MIKKLIKIVISVFILGIILHQWIFPVTSINEIPILLNATRAKEFCTCYFLLQKGEKYCLNRVDYGYPNSEYKVDHKHKKVSFSSFGATRTAQVKDFKYGCLLQ